MISYSYMDSVENKIKNGETLDENEIVYLYDSASLKELGRLARSITDKISGNRVSFVSNLILNYTNICNVRCHFCAFYRKQTDSDAYTLSVDGVVDEIKKYYEPYGIKQLLIQGGVNSFLDLSYYTELFQRIKNEFPGLGIHGLSTSELHFISIKAHIPVRELLIKLRESGLETIPGAGGEILDGSVRKRMGRPEESGRQWLEIMEEAHKLGIHTSATMMFGHLETSMDKAHHMLSILELQKKYHGFLSFTPWNFEPGNTEMAKEGYKYRSGGVSVLKNIAIARIVFNKDLPVIQSSWLTNGMQMAQMAILFGANDWGGTIYDEKVIPATGKQVGNLRKDYIINSIKQLNMIPVERDNMYHPIKTY
ncbi:MAG: CofH family radical SAM protein [Candidatus Thermoplasmatota archaeon]|nr:CofH family radical SAM protein [Candidatus Thermoplasmatota archaeon]